LQPVERLATMAGWNGEDGLVVVAGVAGEVVDDDAAHRLAFGDERGGVEVGLPDVVAVGPWTLMCCSQRSDVVLVSRSSASAAT
jgi:hypothetical protein